jgi:hypothetical protein
MDPPPVGGDPLEVLDAKPAASSVPEEQMPAVRIIASSADRLRNQSAENHNGRNKQQLGFHFAVSRSA